MLRVLEKLNAANCTDIATRANWIYPITGAIGMGEVVRTYIRLEKLTDFGTGFASGDLPLKPKADSVVFSDDIDYTTEFGGSATPTLELASIVGKFRLTKATIMAEAKRKDIHSVTVALAQDGQSVDLPETPQLTELGVNFGNSRAGARTLDAAVVRGAPAKARVLYELERRRLLKEDERVTARLVEVLRPTP